MRPTLTRLDRAVLAATTLHESRTLARVAETAGQGHTLDQVREVAEILHGLEDLGLVEHRDLLWVQAIAGRDLLDEDESE